MQNSHAVADLHIAVSDSIPEEHREYFQSCLVVRLFSFLSDEQCAQAIADASDAVYQDVNS